MNKHFAQQVTGTVTAVKTTGHTYPGNPIKVITLRLTEDRHPFATGTVLDFRISDNASLVYAVENAEFRDQPHTFELTRAGRISGRYVAAVSA